MTTPTVKRKERDAITILNGGLTAATDFLAAGAISGLGYKVQHLNVPDQAALQTGKEFGNRAQCNPTYFTVGNLVKFLIDKRDKDGMSTKDIIDKYVFISAGACGPCRFGMYVTEYRKALRDAGFDGFRVMLFQQKGGLAQATGEEAGIEFKPAFFIAILKALACGDVLNAIGYRIRPYEVRPGATNEAIEEAKKIVYQALHEQTNIFAALYRCRKLFAAIEVDKLRPRPRVSIIGEFWAMTTEGDGNYHLQKFLESEGAENDIQLTTAWLLYNIWEVKRDTAVRADLRGADGGKRGLEGKDEGFAIAKRIATMRAADAILRAAFKSFAWPIGLYDYHLADMDEVAEFAKDYYSNDLRGGEGHMEVGKLIMNVVRNKAHMTLSVKPFGCMPSSGVSDGVQSLITAKFPGSIFCAVETSGDGAANFYSRVQMYLYKAKIAAEQELEKALVECGVTEDEVRTFLKKNPKYGSALHHAPHVVSGSAANLVYEVAPLITKTRLERAGEQARAAGERVRGWVAKTPARAMKLVSFVRAKETRERLREDWALVKDVVGGKVKARLMPLVEKLSGTGDTHAPN
jgi:predicted nucleotide-binding protein (sugar kinase/HSP70/actin superfamily)